MQFWYWVAFLMAWFVLGPIFVMIFSTVGLGYYAGNGVGQRTAPDRLIRRSGLARSPLADDPTPMIPAFRGASDTPFSARPESGLEPVWWTDRRLREDEILRKVVGGD